MTQEDEDDSYEEYEQEDDDSGISGWVWFFLIFVVGNGILYATTGIFFIPIPRK